ncbi:MAG: S41 family peptidase [Pseudomonadales bacterium]
MTMMPSRYWALLGCALLCACGGGGGGGSRAPTPAAPSPTPAPSSSDFDRGIFQAPSVYKDLCTNPRSGPGFADLPGTTEDENDWLRAWSHDLYLWYEEIVDEDPEQFQTLPYFDLQRTFSTTPSGAEKDQFHFTFDTQKWEQLSQAGVSAGYGLELAVVQASPPRQVYVAFVEPGSPAGNVGLTRGERIVGVDGFDIVSDPSKAAVDAINAALLPSAAGQQHDFVLEAFDGSSTRSVSLTSANVTSDPVPVLEIIGTASGPVGYLLFNTHIATAEEALIDAVNSMIASNVADLVLDLRYNGGGFLDIANELAFMIAGPAAAQGRVFDEIQFNDKHLSVNPVTGAALAPDFFHTTSQGFSVTSGQNLPSLSLPRVFVLTGPGTCSASETIINGLRGIDVEVIVIGEQTCGKPYGFYPFDNCGTTYFSIQFSGSNEKGFGDYADGFIPRETEDPNDAAVVKGCVVADDLGNALGDPAESRLATALSYIANGSCPASGTLSGASKSLVAAKSLRANSSSAIGSTSVQMPGSIKRR